MLPKDKLAVGASTLPDKELSIESMTVDHEGWVRKARRNNAEALKKD